MVKILSGSAMVALDAALCAVNYADWSSSGVMLGAIVLSGLGAVPLVSACADAWFASLHGPQRPE